jgi:hypothetical protein
VIFPYGCDAFGLGWAFAAARPTQQEIDMTQDAKRYRALRWLAQADLSEDPAKRKILDSVPQSEDTDDPPTLAQLDAAFDKVVAYLEQSGVDLTA